MRVIIKKNSEEVAKEAAGVIKKLLKENPESVLGLPTGSTPLGLYKELVRLNKEKEVSFKRIKTFNLDEYFGLKSSHPQSYRYYMDTNFFNLIDIEPENTFIPAGEVDMEEVAQQCKDYEEKIKDVGGISLQVLGIGQNGHIGFNEPGSLFDSRTRIVSLSQQTINDNSRFFNNPEEVPKFAITMGIGTILEAKELLLLAIGKSKAEIISKVLNGPITNSITATSLQLHKKVTILLDEEAASALV